MSAYRDMLELLREEFHAPMIPLYKVARFIGKRPDVLLKDVTFPIKRVGRINYVPITALARWMTC